MYPDLIDVQRSAQSIEVSVNPRDMLADVALTWGFLQFASHKCHWLGGGGASMCLPKP
jgi:hypothetical protein